MTRESFITLPHRTKSITKHTGRFLKMLKMSYRSTNQSSPLPIAPTSDNLSLLNDLAHQSMDATTDHAQGDGTRPTAAEQQQIVDFEMALFTAQAVGNGTGRLDTQGAQGGPLPLVAQPFFISANSSVHFLLPQFEQPGGMLTPGDGQFTSAIFNAFDAWAARPAADPRASVARGQALFNSKSIDITGVAGINDDVSAGGLVAAGIPSLQGTCGTCHDTPGVGIIPSRLPWTSAPVTPVRPTLLPIWEALM
jgi:hypothetical protein